MRSEDEIKEKLAFHEKVIDYFTDLYNKGQIPKGTLDVQIADSIKIVDVLKWILKINEEL